MSPSSLYMHIIVEEIQIKLNQSLIIKMPIFPFCFAFLFYIIHASNAQSLERTERSLCSHIRNRNADVDI